MKDFVPSMNLVLALMVAALLGFCLLLRAELAEVRAENAVLTQDSLELADLKYQAYALHGARMASARHHPGTDD